jgi:hypothetical protein
MIVHVQYLIKLIKLEYSDASNDLYQNMKIINIYIKQLGRATDKQGIWVFTQ